MFCSFEIPIGEKRVLFCDFFGLFFSSQTTKKHIYDKPRTCAIKKTTCFVLDNYCVLRFKKMCFV